VLVSALPIYDITGGSKVTSFMHLALVIINGLMGSKIFDLFTPRDNSGHLK